MLQEDESANEIDFLRELEEATQDEFEHAGSVGAEQEPDEPQILYCDFCGGTGEDVAVDLVPPDYRVTMAWCDRCNQRLFGRGGGNPTAFRWVNEGF